MESPFSSITSEILAEHAKLEGAELPTGPQQTENSQDGEKEQTIVAPKQTEYAQYENSQGEDAEEETINVLRQTEDTQDEDDEEETMDAPRQIEDTQLEQLTHHDISEEKQKEKEEEEEKSSGSLDLQHQSAHDAIIIEGDLSDAGIMGPLDIQHHPPPPDAIIEEEEERESSEADVKDSLNIQHQPAHDTIVEEGKSSHEEGKSSHEEGKSSHEEGKSSHEEGKSSHEEGKSSHEEGKSSHADIIDTLDIQHQLPHNDTIEEESSDQPGAVNHFDLPHQSTHDDMIEERESSDAVFMGSLDTRHQPIHNDIMKEVESFASSSGDPDDGKINSIILPEPSDEDLAAKWKAALDDEFLDDDDDELLPDDDDDGEPADNPGMDPSALFGSDDEGFLKDLEDEEVGSSFLVSVTTQNGYSSQSNTREGRSESAGRYAPAAVTDAAPVSNKPYAPAAPFLTDLSRTSTAPLAPSPYPAAVSNLQAPFQRPALPKAQSFADKSKGGYSSPYDLPESVVKPRKRVSMQQINRANAATANIAAPRGSSMFTQPPPPTQVQQGQPQASTAPGQSPAIKTVRKSQSGFFEDLPLSGKPKLAPRHSSGLPSPVLTYGAPHNILVPLPMGPASPHIQNFQPNHASPQPLGLIVPERVNPYDSLPFGNVSVPPIASRYSPAPSQSSTQMAPPPSVQSRYSPAPTLPRQQTATYTNYPLVTSQQTPPLMHQPRTSSPLAHFERHTQPRSQSVPADPTLVRRTSSSGQESNLRYQALPSTREVDENEQLSPHSKSYGELRYNQPISPPSHLMQPVQTPPQPPSLASRLVNSPPKRINPNYAPQPISYGQPPAPAPPKRSQTQSPGARFGGPSLEMNTSVPYKRPASVELPPSPRVSIGYPTMSTTTRPRGFSQGLNYIAPADGRELDPMQRWRGAPVFAWGVGGIFVTSFPKDVPRYGMHSTVNIVRSPGEVKVRSIKDVDPLQARFSSFPGPLKGKSKKKEVLGWLSSGIEMLEQSATYPRTSSHLSHDDNRTEERILLWKILSVFIENDGILEGNPAVEKAVRLILSPGLDDDFQNTPLYTTGAGLSGISQSSSAVPRAEPVDPSAVDQLRKHLLRGEREKAVWEAVDKRLWAHAMIISNTVSRDLYKRVAQEFVQKEVKNVGDNTESLAALYEIFAGNFEESVDELVPPSARAGFQMVSTSTAAGPSKDSMDGLDRWRETLSLVLSNRSTDDTQALNALGKLLSGYGRAEAAHICFLFSRSLSIFGGIDDPRASIALVGSDHLRQPYDFDRELEPILLSEVFEYGMALAAPSSALTVSSPHLSIYKLQHAKILAEYGFRDKALQYCEVIGLSMSSQTRRSPYHHNLLASELDDLSKRLKQSPKDDNGSWISKPSIDKAKGSVWATFNKFVSGDGGEGTVGAATGGSDIGPFARIAGGTPTISRSPSNSDIYNMPGNSAMPITKASSRYAPGANFTQEPQPGTSVGSQSRASFEDRSSEEFRRYDPQRQMSDHKPDAQSANVPASYMPQNNSTYAPQSSFAQRGYSYDASPYNPQTPVTEMTPSSMFSSPQPVAGSDGQQQPGLHTPDASFYQSPPSKYEPRENTFGAAAGGHEPFSSDANGQASFNGYESPTGGYEPPTGGYEPPSSGYEPPSYEPPSYEPSTLNNEPDSPVETRPKEKSFMNDDNDDIPALRNVPAAGNKTKAEKDREADDAFRKAAEADAQKSKEAPAAKKGWGLGGWFGGAKKEADVSAQPNKAIRAKLGEESSFVYDPDLKRWIDKKAGAEQVEAKSAIPPPPRLVGPPRTASAGPTSQPRPPMAILGLSQNRAVSESTTPVGSQNEHPPLQMNVGLAPPSMNRMASNGSMQAPPSRPGTAISTMSNASSIEDLLGPAMPRKGSGAVAKAAKKKRGSRYIDVMDKGA